MSDLRRGPFINEDGDVWVPVTVGGISKAWPIARETMGWDTEKLVFVGMQDDVWMSLHEEVPLAVMDDDPDDPHTCELEQPCTWQGRTYHFRNEGY